MAFTSDNEPRRCGPAVPKRWATSSRPVESSAVWDELRSTPEWAGPALWLHGDLHPSNMLTYHGRLSAVIDFGDITSGDPATDLARHG